MPTRIDILCPRSPLEEFAGIENYVFNLSKELSSLGYKIEIITTADEEKTDFLGKIRVRAFKRLTKGEAYYLAPGIFKCVKGSNADIIHCNGFNNLVTPLGILAKRPRQKLFVTMNSSGPSTLFRKLLWVPYVLLFNLLTFKIDKIICVSEFEKNRFSRLLFLAPKEKFTVIPNGVDLDEFEKIKVKRRKNRILSVGRLVKNKGFDHLILSFAKVLQKNQESELIIIGSGPEEKNLKKMAGIAKNKIIFKKPFPKEKRQVLITEFKKATLFILLSNYESQGIVVSEAVCAGTPAIVNNTSALAEFVERNGVIGVNNRNHNLVADKILEVLKNPAKFVPKKQGIVPWELVASETIKEYKC